MTMRVDAVRPTPPQFHASWRPTLNFRSIQAGSLTETTSSQCASSMRPGSTLRCTARFQSRSTTHPGSSERAKLICPCCRPPARSLAASGPRRRRSVVWLRSADGSVAESRCEGPGSNSSTVRAHLQQPGQHVWVTGAAFASDSACGSPSSYAPFSSLHRELRAFAAPNFGSRVRAGVRFAVAPKRLVNGETIKMKGRVLGLPVPSTGKTIVIQARARGVPSLDERQYESDLVPRAGSPSAIDSGGPSSARSTSSGLWPRSSEPIHLLEAGRVCEAP